MTIDEKLDLILEKLSTLEAQGTISQITFYENLSNDAVVGSDYVAYRFQCKQESVGRSFGTQHIPRLPNRRERAFIKREVDGVYRNLNQTVAEKAAKLRARK